MTMGMNYLTWSKGEKQIARRAFDGAHEREYRDLLHKTREMANGMREPADLWRLHDFLARTLREIDEKYDYRYSVLTLVFCRLLCEGWLKIEELEGLCEDKLGEIQAYVQLAHKRSERAKQQEQTGTDDDDAKPA